MRELRSSPARWRCTCDLARSVAWLDELTSDALAGDADAPFLVAEVADHYLAVVHRQGMAA